MSAGLPWLLELALETRSVKSFNILSNLLSNRVLKILLKGSNCIDFEGSSMSLEEHKILMSSKDTPTK